LGEEPVILESKLDILEGFRSPGRLRTELLNLIYRGKDEIRLRFSPKYIERVIDMYYQVYPDVNVDSLDRSGIYSYLVPVDDFESRIPPILSDIKDSSDLAKLSEYIHDFAIASYDSSWHSAGAHFVVSFVVYNTGYYYYSFDGSGGSGSHPKVVIGLPDDWDNDIEIKNHEYKVASALADKLLGLRKFMFMDESLNLIFSVKWSLSKRERFVQLVEAINELLVSKGVVPLGVFYTKSRDIIRTLSSMDSGIDIVLTDKAIMNRVLEIGERSPLFKVYNKVVDKFGLDIMCFYLKLGERNIIRVEFPSRALDFINIDDIHVAVYVDAIRGGGYPYCLIRAHEMAVLDYEDRLGIEDVIGDILGLPADMLYSMKQYSKWRSVA